MWKLIKRIFSILIAVATVALVLNLKVADRPARDYAMDLWRHEEVQKAYEVIRERAWALIRKDISVEDVFKTDLPNKEGPAQAVKPQNPGEAAESTSPATKTQVLEMENLSEQDRKDLERILQNATQKNSGKKP